VVLSGKHFGKIEIKAFTVTVLKECLARTLLLRKNNIQLLLSYQKPHKPVSSETIGKWIKKTLTKAGIDIKQHRPGPSIFIFIFFNIQRFFT
jgi:site-specific recombinase XerD